MCIFLINSIVVWSSYFTAFEEMVFYNQAQILSELKQVLLMLVAWDKNSKPWGYLMTAPSCWQRTYSNSTISRVILKKNRTWRLWWVQYFWIDILGGSLSVFYSISGALLLTEVQFRPQRLCEKGCKWLSCEQGSPSAQLGWFWREKRQL